MLPVPPPGYGPALVLQRRARGRASPRCTGPCLPFSISRPRRMASTFLLPRTRQGADTLSRAAASTQPGCYPPGTGKSGARCVTQAGDSEHPPAVRGVTSAHVVQKVDRLRSAVRRFFEPCCGLPPDLFQGLRSCKGDGLFCEILQRAWRTVISADFKRLFALELQQVTHFRQRPGQLQVGQPRFSSCISFTRVS
jgi:hypothetical protein